MTVTASTLPMLFTEVEVRLDRAALTVASPGSSSPARSSRSSAWTVRAGTSGSS